MEEPLMAKSEHRRQKQLAKRKLKRANRQRQLAREKNAGVRERLTAARDAPIHDCMIADSIDDEGFGILVLSRDCKSEIAFASFLVDRYCLGVKDVDADVLPRTEYAGLIDCYKERMTFDEITPATARRLVEDAVAYARELGFPPHRDYAKGRPIFGDINPDLADEIFEMGKDGKPLYISGPDDAPFRSNAILNTLEKTCGPGNYHFLVGIDPDELDGPHFDIDDDEWDEDESDEE
jgi:hypothetical protein